MGRPLNKRFFASGVGATIGCTVHDGGGVIESAIISQKSNSQYRVAGVGGTPLVFTDLAFLEANPDTVIRTGGVSFLTSGFAVGDNFRIAASENTGENDGVYTILTVNATTISITPEGDFVTNAEDTDATMALVSPNGIIGTLVQGVPNAAGEMQVTVTPEIVDATAEATITFGTDGTVNNAIVNAVTLVTGGNGYFTPGSFTITIASDAGFEAGTEAIIDFTVANGAMDSVAINDGGAGYTEDLSGATIVAADITDPASVAPVESAKIINARTVKTFEGNIYQWPASGGAGTPEGRREADLQSTDL